MTRAKRRPRPTSTAEAPVSPAKKSIFGNREQSWLAFNRRVLDQARNAENPLLERVKFLAIVSSNLDEFFEIRVAGLMQQADSEAGSLTLDGLTPRELLQRIQKSVHDLVTAQYACWHTELVPLLAKAGIEFRTAAQLDATERVWTRAYFEKASAASADPAGSRSGSSLPAARQQDLNVLVSIDESKAKDEEKHLVLLPVPRSLPRIVRLTPECPGPLRHIFLREIIKLCADRLVPGYKVPSDPAIARSHGSILLRLCR